MKQDKFLLGIVIGIVLLVVVTLAVAFNQPEAAYQPDDTPGGVVHNYVLAIQDEDYARAYGYISPTLRGYPPNTVAFTNDLKNHTWNNSSFESLAIDSSTVEGADARVTLSVLSFYSGDLFSSGQNSYTLDFVLKLEAGGWKITNADNYFPWCWNEALGCQ